MLWSATARRLLDSKRFGEDLLAIVALYLCVHDVLLLVSGKRRIPADDESLADCPIATDELQRLDARLEAFRNEIVHLSDKTQDGGELRTRYTHDPPYFVFESSVGDRGKLEFDSISRPEIEGLLNTIDPWLRDHWERITHAGFDEDAAVALGEKIDRTMRALADDADQAINPEG
jgi:hypothetical protein